MVSLIRAPATCFFLPVLLQRHENSTIIGVWLARRLPESSIAVHQRSFTVSKLFSMADPHVGCTDTIRG